MSNLSYQAPAVIDRWKTVALGLGGVATLAMIAIALLVPDEREQVLRSWLLGFLFWGGIGIGGLGILHLQYLTGGAWGVVIRRTVEAASRTIPVIIILFIPIVAGVNYLYKWNNAVGDKIVEWRGWYLTWEGFAQRAVIYFILLWVMQYLLSKWSARIDASTNYTDAAKHLETASRFSGPSLVIYSIVVSFAAIDWSMTLDPHWFSTIWGLLYVIGWALACFSFVIALFAALSDKEPFNKVLGKKHFHDIGKLMLALVMVWAYFNFSQFLIIWSGNIPEETPWYLERMSGAWGLVGIILVVFHFAVPFLILLSRDIKRNAKYLALIGVFILLMRLLDLFYHVAPSPNATEAGASFDVFWILYIVGPIAVGGIWLWAFFGQLQKRPLMPVMDPFFEDAVEHGKGH